ncbi:unnamed protein product [Paramecium primaurelia]|uniref:guanylate cyclase n=1 Tax=Paramecium primaurelia TaxID=5886 RepID=A0A8S1LVN1_PARPR|nr:unnamed protein product [Paramecium primaurelia]
MEKQKSLIDLTFEYGQSYEDKVRRKQWLYEYMTGCLKEKILELLNTMFGDYINDLFLIVSFILILVGIVQNDNQEDVISSLTLFIVYLLPFLIEAAIRTIQLFLEQKQSWQSILLQTRITYTRLKGFKREDMVYSDIQNYIRQARSSSIRSSQHLDSQSNVPDVLPASNVEDVFYSNLKRGDFILLSRNQQCPGDLVILDMSDRHGYFYSKSYFKQAFLQRKEPMKTTKVEMNAPNKGDLNYLRKILKGKLTFNNNYNFEQFEGHIKLSKDPKGEPILPENILFFGQALQFSEWVFGILINVGGQSLYSRNVQSIKKQQHNRNRYKNLSILQLFLYIIMPIIASLIQYYGYQSNQSFSQIIFNCYQQFLAVLPSYLNLFLHLFDVFLIINENRSQQQQQSKDCKELILETKLASKQQSFNYPVNMKEIMNTTHVFLNIQILSDAKIEALCHGDNIYQIDQTLIPDLVLSQSFKKTQFYYNLIKQVNDENIEILQEKIDTISPNVPPQKLSITSHQQYNPILNKEVGQNKRPFFKQNTQTLHSPMINNPNSARPSLEIYHSMDGGFLAGNLLNQQQHSQVSQEPEEEQVKQIQIYRENTLVELGLSQPFQYFELFSVISLCHLTRSELMSTGEENRSSQKNSKLAFSERERIKKPKFNIDQYFLAEDEALLKLSKLFKISYKTYGFNRQEQLCYVLKINDLEIPYIIHYRLYHQGFIDYDETKNNKMFKIPSRFIAMMIQDNNFQLKESNQLVLLCRFCIVTISDIPGYEKFDLVKKASLQKQIQYLINRGDIIICFLKMSIKEQDLQKAKSLIINDYEKTIQLIELLSENQYDIIGLFGISQNDNQDLIKESFITNRSRIIIQSEKPYELVLPFCIKNSVLHNETITYNFQSSSRDDILYQIRQIISSLNQEDPKKSSTLSNRRNAQIQNDKIKINNNALIIDGNVLDLILNDKYLTNHFGFIIHFNKIIIVYNMNNNLKQRLLNFVTRYDSEYYSSFCVNYSAGSHGLVRMSNFSYQRHEEIESDVMGFINQYSINIDELELFDNLVIKTGFQLFQIKDATQRICIQWNLCFALLQMIFYCFPHYNGQLLFKDRLLILQILVPAILLIYSIKTIYVEQEYLSVKINTIKQKSLDLKNNHIIELLLETIMDVILLTIVRYTCYMNNIQIGVYNTKEEIAIYFSFILIIHVLKLAFLSKELYLKLFLFLSTLLLILLHITIEMISLDYVILKVLLIQPTTIMSLLILLAIKIVMNLFGQFSIYLYNNFLERSQQDIDFNLILEIITKELQSLKNIQYLIKKLFKDSDIDLSVKQILGENKNQLIQLNNYTLNFEQQVYNQEFIQMYISKWKFIGIITNLSYFFGLDIFLLIHYGLRFEQINTALFSIMLFLTFCQVFLINQSCYPNYKKLIIYFGFLQTIYRLFIISVDVFDQENKAYAFIFYYLVIFSLTQQINYKYVFIVIQQIMTLISGIVMLYANQNKHTKDVYLGEIIVLFVSFSIISLLSRYQDDVTQREDYICWKVLEIERQKHQSVMSLLLPPFVLGRLDQGHLDFSENQGLVGIIFVDMCSFDVIVSEEDQNIVQLMDNIYRQFDQICSSTNCQKIETVGKTYMACSGLKCVEKFQPKGQHLKNPIERLVELAFGIQQEITNFKWGSNQKSFGLKIGIHYGRVLMGVIGSIKPQFSLIGDTVNTTSRLCAHCPEGLIQISLQAYDQIKNVKSIKYTSSKIEAKGKGIIDTFLIEKKRNFEQSFNNKQKKSEMPHIDQKLKFVLNNQQQQQNSFRNQKQVSITAIRQKTTRHLTYKLIPQKQEENQQLNTPQNNQTQQPPTQQIITTQQQGISQKTANLNFTASQLQLFRKQTKRNLMSNQTNMPSLNQIASPQALIQISSNQNVLAPSNKLIHQKSIFSHQQQQNQQISQQIDKFDKYQQQSSIHLPQQDPSNQNILVGIPDIPLDQSLNVMDSSIKEQTPLNCRNGDQKKFIDSTIRMIKFNDIELFIKSKPEVFNKTIPLFKIQEFFLEGKSITLQENNNNKWHLISKEFLFEAFKNSDDVTKYYENELENGIRSVMISLLLLLIIHIFFIILSQLQQVNTQQAVIRALGCFFILIELYFLQTHFFEWKRKRLLQVILIQLVTQCIILGVFYDQDKGKSVILSIESIITSCLLFAHKWLYVQEKILICAFMFTVWLIIISSVFIIDIWEVFFLLISIALLLQRELLSYLFSYKQMLNQQQIEIKKEDKMNLLSCLLPIHVLSQFLDDSTNSRKFSDVYNDCTILFADIAGFTKYSSSVQPEEVVSMLKNLFDEFDKLTQIHNVFKLYTIGDCYVVIGVTDNFKRDPIQEAFNVVEMSLNMLEAISLVRNQINYHDLHMRIGIHTGNVIGGIIGTDIIRYDVYGKDILIANKMESSSEEGRVLVSETTKKLIEDNFAQSYIFNGRKLINIPSINTTITGFFLETAI